MAEEEGAPGEGRIGEHHIGRLRSVRAMTASCWAPAGTDEDVLDVERDRLRALQRGALGEDRVPVPPVVEVGLSRQGDVLGAGGLDDAVRTEHPVRNRTRSPRSAKCRATVSSGVTCPWIGTVAMMIDDMARLLVGVS